MHKPQLPIHEFGDFRIDTGRRLLLGGDGLPRALAPKAFDTLLYMVEQGDVIVEKDALMKAVWPDTVVEENNLNQNISILRRVLGEERKEHRYIVTVPGRGYRFVAAVRTYAPQTVVATVGSVRSLAVLPFQPLVTKDRDVSLEMGMADTLIARLSSIGNTIVRPISAVRKYAGPAQDALSAGRELGVEFVTEGSLQRSGKKIRVNVRLLNVLDGFSAWAGTFDERFTDIFALQDTISERVVRALKLKLTPNDKSRLLKHHTDDAKAYQLYLKGRYYWWKNAPEEFGRSRDYFRRAVEADPSYALGYCGLNSYYGFGAAWGMLSPKDAWHKAEWAITKALRLDDSLAEVHLGLAALKMVRYLDWPAAEKHALRAIELNPQFDEAHYLYSFFLGVLGRWDEAIAEGKKALACDPFSVRICQHIGNIFYNARRYHEAVQQYQRTLELDPQNSPAHDSLADAYEQLGQRRETVAHRLRSAELSQDVEMAEILSSGGDGHRSRRALVLLAEKRLGQLIQKRKRSAHVPAINIARAYIRMGEKENALSWLQTASEERNVFALTMGNDPFYDPLRTDKRFGEILQRINLPVCQPRQSKERNAR